MAQRLVEPLAGPVDGGCDVGEPEQRGERIVGHPATLANPPTAPAARGGARTTPAAHGAARTAPARGAAPRTAPAARGGERGALLYRKR
ncbi:hypothetical protein GCM10012279_44920 [Micromonospora yangpuensis]|nr:hypothetical protein GCM10012279_44920 [Micromonospora yangpuensis]